MELGKFLIIILIVVGLVHIGDRIIELIKYLSDKENERKIIEYKDNEFWDEKGDPDE